MSRLTRTQNRLLELSYTQMVMMDKLRIIVDEDRHIMVGATFIGPQVGDLLHAPTIAIVGQVPLEKLWHAIPPFPTVNEVWIDLLENYGF